MTRTREITLIILLGIVAVIAADAVARGIENYTNAVVEAR